MNVTFPANMRVITKEPGFHWFGYYDKLQFDPDGRYVLGMESDSAHGGAGRRMYLVDIGDIVG